MRDISIEPDKDGGEDYEIFDGPLYIGKLRKANHGPGYFLSLLDDKGKWRRWKNAAPGARIQQERDHVSKETYVKNLKQAKQRVLENP